MRLIRLSSNFTSYPLAQKSVLTLGNFDGMHLGHRLLLDSTLQYAQEHQLSSLLLSFEPHPREFFNRASAPARLSTLREKIQFLQQLNFSYVAVCRFDQSFANLSAEDFVTKILVRQLNVAQIFVGDDFVFGKDRLGNFSLLQQLGQIHGFTVASIASVKKQQIRISSSAIRQYLHKGEMQQAAQYLGDYYSMDGQVQIGRQLGRQLGFPTANLYVRHLPLPLTGVFAVQIFTKLSSTPLYGVANLGVRPTLNGQRPLLEVHIFAFNQDIYGEHLQVKFCHKIRDEMKFANLNQLQQQISQDAESAKQFFAHNDLTIG